jgi:hypothetical protein
MKRTMLAAALLLLTTPAMAAEYTNIVMEKDLAVSAETAWKKIGPYCSLSEWLKMSCEITAGDKAFGDLGSVRLVAGRVTEVLVAKTALSYTYAMEGAKDLYHGTVEVVPKGANASKIVYTLLYDNSALGTAEAKATDRANRTKRFTAGLDVMKTIAEAK